MSARLLARVNGLADSIVILSYLSAASALFLSIVVVSAIARQKTLKVFQKHVLLTAVFLLTCAVISNVLITIFATVPSIGNPTASLEGIILSKRLQATFDYLFGIVIGAFVVVATTPSINSTRDFVRHLREEFPNAYTFTTFIMVLALVSVYISPMTVISTVPTIVAFEPYVVLISGIGIATLLLFATYRFSVHLQRTKPDPDVRRATYLVILGISGFALGELLFEIILPAYGVDLRAPGFILQMALLGLIAFGTRERSFLQDLILPQAEAHLMTRPQYNLEKGYTYGIPGPEGDQAFVIFKDLVTHGAHGLCITRRSPKGVMASYGLEKTPILWLSRVASEKNTVRPTPPENVANAIDHFIEVGEGGVVLLDGFEYLTTHNDFLSILALLHDINEKVSVREAILLLPLDPQALNERELALIRREIRFIEPMTEVAPNGAKAIAR